MHTMEAIEGLKVSKEERERMGREINRLQNPVEEPLYAGTRLQEIIGGSDNVGVYVEIMKLIREVEAYGYHQGHMDCARDILQTFEREPSTTVGAIRQMMEIRVKDREAELEKFNRGRKFRIRERVASN